MALQSSTEHVELWENANLLPEDESPTLAAAIRAQEILHTALESKAGKPYEANLSAIEEMDIWPWEGHATPKDYDFLARGLYPSEMAKGLFSSGDDLMEFMAEKSNKYYIYMMFTHAPAIRRAISENLPEIAQEIQAWKSFRPEKPLVWAVEQIPADTDTLFLGEQHVDSVVEQLPSMLGALKKKAKGREIIFLTEFLSEEYRAQLPDDENHIRKYNDRYLPVWKALKKKNIPVIGLEPEFVRGRVGDQEPPKTDHMIFLNDCPHCFDGLWCSLEGIRARNQHWLNLYQKIRAEHPNALIVIYAGYQHVSYIEPFSLANAIPGNNFVIHMLASWYSSGSDAFVAPLKIPAFVKWSKHKLGQAIGFDVRVKL